ncbi:MAG: flagellar type III secretion system pore protein FliP [Cohaesibacter sp.]|jgi:flagellar biosynthetic protein FliP|nr:flagellar type III secretion system pore protein FliP [Cohaesibacter sp.]
MTLILSAPAQDSQRDPSSNGCLQKSKTAGWIARTLLAALVSLGFWFGLSAIASAQQISIGLGDDITVTERSIQLVALITVLSLAPSILIMVTSFTRIVVVLSLLRSAIGLQTAPPNTVMISLALFLTAFIMAPTFEAAYEAGVEPLVAGSIEAPEAFDRASRPFHAFMRQHVREKDLALFLDMANTEAPATPEEVSLRVLVPAFMISELRRAFEIGFLIFLPFIIIDLVVASILMSMGMMMLPPVVISLPFKLIFFVLVDGWNLITGSLVKSFLGT